METIWNYIEPEPINLEPPNPQNPISIIIAILGIIVMMIILSSCASKIPQVIVHKYDYIAKDYPTKYDSPWDDPTLIVFMNDSYRKVWIEINKKTIVLEPYGSTGNLHFGVGEHQCRYIIEKPTAEHGILKIIRNFKIHIRAEGRGQIFHIRD